MLTVTPASVSVTAASGTAIYGNAPANPGLVATGLQNGEGIATLSGLSSSFALDPRTGVGTYALGVVGTNTNPNYNVTGTSGGSYAVTPRPITVTATSEARLQGGPNPPLSYQIGGLGLVNGDTLGGSLFTSALPSSPIGAYPIVQGTLAASPNYAVSFVPGILSVTPNASLGASGLASPIVPRTAIVEGADDLLSGLLSSPIDGTLASTIVEGLSDPRFGGIVVCVNGRCVVVPRSVVSPKTAVNQKQASP